MKLSKVQGEIDAAGLLDKPSVLCIPTGGGKTWLARVAIRRVIQAGRKAIYLAPLRAIARELGQAWREEFEGYALGVYTGEVGVDATEDNPTPAHADILIATPEKLDLYLRTFSDHLHWLADVDLLVVDELHTLEGDRRGATLEGVIARMRAVNPFTRVLGLSATLGNPKELAKWVGGEAYVSKERPVPLSWRIRTHKSGEPKAEIVCEEVLQTISEGGQAIVFVQSRPRAESLAKFLSERGIKAAAHHAGLSRLARNAAESGFRNKTVQTLCATPTLAMGCNFPARLVVMHDLSRWEGSGWRDLSVNEVWQMAGRAGRLGQDDRGEVVLIAPQWNQKSARAYVAGQFENIKSSLGGSEQAFSEQLLVTFGSRMAVKESQAARFMQSTFLGQSVAPGVMEKRVRQSLADMERAGMVLRNEEGYIRATKLGRIAVRFQLSARTVIAWSKIEEVLPSASLLDLLIIACASPDFTARMRVDHAEVPGLQAMLGREVMGLRHLSERERSAVLGCRGKDMICAVKTAQALRAWTRCGNEDEAATSVWAMEHELEEARKEGVRLLQAMSALSDAKLRAVEPGMDDMGASVPDKIKALGAMVCAGLDDAQATLALIDGVGPVMARRLAGAGFSDIEDLAMSSPERVAEIDGISLKRATKWVDEAGKFVTKGGAFRYKEVFSGEEETIRGGSSVSKRGLDFYRWQRASNLDVEADQAGWIVRGGSEAHRVVRGDDGLACDCHDAAKGRMCKHKIAVRHLLGDPAVPRFDEGFPEAEVKGMDLEAEWGSQRWAMAR